MMKKGIDLAARESGKEGKVEKKRAWRRMAVKASIFTTPSILNPIRYASSNEIAWVKRVDRNRHGRRKASPERR